MKIYTKYKVYNVPSISEVLKLISGTKDEVLESLNKTSLGLDNVDNTSDKDKPISDLTQEALDNKVDKVSGKSLVLDSEITKLGSLKSQSEITADINAEKSRALNAESILANRLNTLADSDDETLDLLSEIVAYIKSNKTLIDSITTNKVSVSDVVNNLTSSEINKCLSAAQGKVLSERINDIEQSIARTIDIIDNSYEGTIDISWANGLIDFSEDSDGNIIITL